MLLCANQGITCASWTANLEGPPRTEPARLTVAVDAPSPLPWPERLPRAFAAHGGALCLPPAALVAVETRLQHYYEQVPELALLALREQVSVDQVTLDGALRVRDAEWRAELAADQAERIEGWSTFETILVGVGAVALGGVVGATAGYLAR